MSNRRPSGSGYAATRPVYAAPPPPAAPAAPGHHQTLRLPNAPPLPSHAHGKSRPPPSSSHEGRRTSTKPEGNIEIEYVEQSGVEAHKNEAWTLFEIWTRNRVYHVDSNLECIAVITRSTGRAEANHPLRGARLTGGERRNKSAHLVDIFFPLPCPGTEAVFRSDAKKQGQFARTSTIERVVLRVRRVKVNSLAEGQAWDAIMGKSRPR